MDTYLAYKSAGNFASEEGYMEFWIKPAWDDTEQEVMSSVYVEEDTRTLFSMGGGVDRGILEINEPSCNTDNECEVFTRAECPGIKLICQANRCVCPEVESCNPNNCGINCPTGYTAMTCSDGMCKCVKNTMTMACYEENSCPENCGAGYDNKCINVNGNQGCRCTFNCDTCNLSDPNCRVACIPSRPCISPRAKEYFDTMSTVPAVVNTCRNNPQFKGISGELYIDCPCMCEAFVANYGSVCTTSVCTNTAERWNSWCNICGRCVPPPPTSTTTTTTQPSTTTTTRLKIEGCGQGERGGPGLPDIFPEEISKNAPEFGGGEVIPCPPNK